MPNVRKRQQRIQELVKFSPFCADILVNESHHYHSRMKTSWQVDRRLLDNTGYDLKHHLDTAAVNTKYIWLLQTFTDQSNNFKALNVN